jgi:hypothetical protein
VRDTATQHNQHFPETVRERMKNLRFETELSERGSDGAATGERVGAATDEGEGGWVFSRRRGGEREGEAGFFLEGGERELEVGFSFFLFGLISGVGPSCPTQNGEDLFPSHYSPSDHKLSSSTSPPLINNNRPDCCRRRVNGRYALLHRRGRQAPICVRTLPRRR